MKLFKLTDSNGQTYGGIQWGEGVTHEGTGEGELCGPGWIHAYTDPVLAVMLNPIHAEFTNPRLWEAEGEVSKTDFGLKVGCRRLTTVRELQLPEVSIEQRIRFGILCAKLVMVNDTTGWNLWADRWLNGTDRTARAATRAAHAAAWDGGREAARVAAWAARATARAALAAEAATLAAAQRPLDLIQLAHQALKDQP